MTDSRLTNWLRVRRGLPARNMSHAEESRRLRRSEAQARAAGLELADLVRLAREFDLPLPIEPTRIVDGVIVHPTLRVG